MRTDIFKIFKRVHEVKLLDRNQISPIFGVTVQRPPNDLGGAQYLEWCFLCGEFTEYIFAFTEILEPAEQKVLIKSGSDANDQLPFKRLLFCLEKAGLSNLKIVLL